MTDERNRTRRTVLKTIPATVAGVGIVGAASGGAQAAQSDNLTTIGFDTDTKTDYFGDAEAHLELRVAGPMTTSVQTNTLGIGWAVNHDMAWYTYFRNPTLEFEILESSNPSNSTIDWVDGYSQGTSSGITADHVQYAIDTMWASAPKPIPAPNPLEVDRTEQLDIDRPGSSFTQDYGNFFGKIDDDSCGGAHFNVSLGTDGSLEDGLYSFEATMSVEIWVSTGRTTYQTDELEATVQCALIVDT